MSAATIRPAANAQAQRNPNTVRNCKKCGSHFAPTDDQQQLCEACLHWLPITRQLQRKAQRR